MASSQHPKVKEQDVKKLRWWPALGAVVVVGMALAACGSGGGSGDSGSIRLINATRTHASLDLLANSAAATSATATDTISAYASVGTGSPVLQLNDAGTNTAVATTSTTVTGGQHYALLAYESSGAVKTAVLTEDFATPTAGTGQFRIFDAAFDAGAIDVYITDPASDIGSASPGVSFPAQTYVQSSVLLSATKGTYRIRVTPSNTKSQILLDTNVTLGDQQIVTVALTPSSGGILLDGAILVQQGDYAAARNTNSRVRLASAVTDGATVTASAGAVAIGTDLAPSMDNYVTVPAANPLNIAVNSASVGAPATTLQAGGDYTLLVYGPSGSATAALIADDNRLPTTAGLTKIRLINGSTAQLTLNAAQAQIGSSIAPGSATVYDTISVTSGANVAIGVAAPGNNSVFSYIGPLAVPSVYTVFVGGSSNTGILRRDR